MCAVGTGKEKRSATLAETGSLQDREVNVRREKKEEIRQGSVNVIWLPPFLRLLGNGQQGM